MSNTTPPGHASFRAGATLMGEALSGVTTRIPVYAQMHEFVAAQAGVPPERFYSDAAAYMPAMLQTQAEYGLDVANITYDIYNIEAEALGQKLILSETGMLEIDRSRPLIEDTDDLALIATPDFARDGRFSAVLDRFALFHEMTGLQPTLGFCGPFTLAANLRGIERLLVDIYTDPAFAASLLDRLTNDVLAPWIDYQKQRFPLATSISGADAIASPPIVNLQILRDWALPYINRLQKLCGDGVYVGNWVGERLLPEPQAMLDLKLKACGRWIQGQDPDAQELSPQYHKLYARQHNVPLILGVGAAFLATSTPAQVEARVREYCRVGARGGRFALYLCNIGATTPPANVRAAVDAAHSIDPSDLA